MQSLRCPNLAQFKTRARTLDMLGRQQIAGVPNAINELFKNAHDAYADKVDVDYYLSDALFVLRDDGLGMTKQDFEDRWLTLGTESKLGEKTGMAPPPKDQRKPLRAILGEKGIGRLSIASIGPQVLVLTRAERDKNHDLTASFINWKIFELPGIDLNQINIPIRTFSKGKLPTRNDIYHMANDVIVNIHNLQKLNKITSSDANRLVDIIKKFDVDPSKLDNELGDPSLKGNGRGTHFIIIPAYETVQAAIEGEKWRASAPPLKKMLIGFTNTMTPDHSPPTIKSSFRYHITDTDVSDIINEESFFTPDEWQLADQHFKGEFDEYGQFKGTVTIYNEVTKDHIVHWKNARGKKTLCGSFKINVAYVQGKKSQTKIPLNEHSALIAKLDQLGGMYIYKDGIRILPYGDSDFDWLDIEKNRTKSASYYYFSYRRMFGLVEIASKNNKELIEKAGREGFIENKAYRQFRSILANFFIQLVADFFREGGESTTEIWVKRRAELTKIYDAMKEKEHNASLRRKKLINDLECFFINNEKSKPHQEVEILIEQFTREIKTASLIKEKDRALSNIIRIETNTLSELEKIRKKYIIPLGRGFYISAQIRNSYDAYIEESKHLGKTLFEPSIIRINKIIEEQIKNTGLDIDRRKRLEKSINGRIHNEEKKLKVEVNDLKTLTKQVSEKTINFAYELMMDTQKKNRELLSELERMNFSELNNEDLIKKRINIDNKLDNLYHNNIKILDSIQAQLSSITWLKDSDNNMITTEELTDALQDKIAILEERIDRDIELSQLGMAIGVIHHEFTGTVKNIRRYLREFKAWADYNENIYPIYDAIKTNFEHLDGYLTLFTPLDKRLYRKKVEITGNGIKQFIEDIFDERIKQNRISFKPTRSFLQKKIVDYPSTFYPVFINLIDNAIYWLKEKQFDRKIVLEADEKGFFISNNGPSIPIQDRDVVFEFGFTRKPHGKGMGLYISKQALLKVGYSIDIINPRLEGGVTFRIEEIKEKEKR